MKLFLPTLLLLPTLDAEAFGLGRSLFTHPLTVYQPGTLFRDVSLDRHLPNTSPRYEITDTKDEFQLRVDVPGVKSSEIQVNVENDMLSLRGERKEEKENYKFSSSFFQSFSLDPSVEQEKITAKLVDGVLTVTAPKDPKKVDEMIQRIPVTEEVEEIPVNVAKPKEDVKDESKETVKA